jgi:hypothetical protein
VFQRCTIRIAYGKCYTLDSLVAHPADGITATTPYAYHLDDILHQVLNRSEIQQLTHIFFYIISWGQNYKTFVTPPNVHKPCDLKKNRI